MNAWGTINGNQTQATSLPYLRVPCSDPTYLCGACSIGGNSYPLVNMGNWNGTYYLKQNITSNISTGSNVVFWAIVKVGG